MTRGQIAIITNEGVMTSIEFNGDMYMPTKKWAGHGRQVINALKRVKDIADYQYEVAKFNKENHHYNDCDRLTYKGSDEMLNFGKEKYFDTWFSDYVYIKNMRNKTVKLTDYEGNTIELVPQEIAVMCFGELERKEN